MMKLAVLMTCHNRRDTTVGCLSRLLPQLGDSDRIFLVDDGSTDGTFGAVNDLKDDRISVLHGDGTLYWARGMRKAWDSADDLGEWDAYLWLNDDTELDENAVRRMKSTATGTCVVVGELKDSKDNIVYGTRKGGLFTGNCVLVTKEAAKKVGKICGEYRHAWADSDYALKCRKAGVTVVSSGVVGRAEGHPNRPSLKGKSFIERWRMLYDPKGWCLHDLWLYRRRNWGVCAAIVSCTHLVIYVLIGER